MTARRVFESSVLLLAVVAGGCKPDVQIAMLPDQPPAGRAAASFVHCVESSTSSCVETGTDKGGWDAFYLLSWLTEGSPVAIMESLPSELASHQNPRAVQQRFIAEVERYAPAIRGAGCEAVDAQAMGPLIDKAGQLAASRLSELGLWQRNMDRVLGGLVEEAHRELDGGSLVRLDCETDPYHLYVGTRESEGEFTVVGLATIMPTQLGGAVPSREMVEQRLGSRSLGLAKVQAPIVEGNVNAWLPFPVEVF